MIKELFKSRESMVILSILLGFGLACMFRKVCSGKSECYVINGPPLKDVKDVVFRVDDACYKYTPEFTECV